MNYQTTLQYLYEQFPCFQHVGKTAYVPSLQNIENLLGYLGNPEKRIRCVHVAGTNGKGSTSHFCASILQEAGYKVGLYTSPHIVDFCERIRVNGKNISKLSVVNFVVRHKAKLDSIQASLFEVTTAMAFDYFKRENVDIAIIEVGLGGRLDSTNVITPLVSVITNIGYDHMQILGNTLAEIAKEKAGIIKPGVPVVVGEWHRETHKVFETIANNNKSHITFASTAYDVAVKDDSQWNGRFAIVEGGETKIEANSGLLGAYQKKNVATVWAVVEQLRKSGFKLSQSAIKRGYRNVVANTNLIGRWQIVSKKPLVVCDTGHNYDGISYTMPQLQSLHKKDVRVVWGMVGDKDISSIKSLLPQDATYYICKPSIERAMPLDKLEQHFQGKNYKKYNTVWEAYKQATRCVSKECVVYVGGSSYVVAEFLQKFLK